VEGRNLEVDFILAPVTSNIDYLASYNAFVKRGADLLLVIGDDIPLLAARVAAASRVPIVMFATDYDPLEAGYVESLARPGGNLTGVFIRQPEVAVKQVELALELFPSNRRLIVWVDRAVMQQGRRGAEGSAIARPGRSVGRPGLRKGDRRNCVPAHPKLWITTNAIALVEPPSPLSR